LAVAPRTRARACRRARGEGGGLSHSSLEQPPEEAHVGDSEKPSEYSTRLGSGRNVASEIEVPNMLANLV
jgi:hypothetical protein